MRVPALAGEPADPVVVEMRGVVDEQAQGTHGPDRLADQASDVGFPGQIATNHRRPPARLFDLGAQALGVYSRIAMVDDDGVARLAEAQSERPADPPRRSGDQGRAPLAARHLDAPQSGRPNS